MALVHASACETGSLRSRAPGPTGASIPIPTGAGTIRVIRSKSEVELVGPRVDAEPGDYLLENEGMIAVVSAEYGNVIDFGPRGARDELSGISPQLFDGLSAVRAPVVLGSQPAPAVLRVEHRASTLPVLLVTFFAFQGKTLLVDSVALPENGYASHMAVGLGERLSWGNVPSWIEGTGFAPERGGDFSARFIGRDGPGLSYAITLLDGTRAYSRFSTVGVPGYYAQARASELVVADGTGNMRRRLLVAASERSIGGAVTELGLPGRRVALPTGLPRGARVEIAACLDDEGVRRPFARFAEGDEDALVPEGCYEGRLVAPGHATTSWMKPESLVTASLPRPGDISVRVTEAGAPLPSRIQLRGLGGTPDPSWGDDPDDGAALSAVVTENGRVDRPVPAGRYRVVVDRGFEYSSFERIIDVEAGARVEVNAELRRVVDTKGWVAADLHLHAAPSPDAPQSLANRVRSLAAGGVEVGVATDHNRVTDYRPAIQELGLGKYVASIVGDEVTTEEMAFGHFNVFPLAAGSAPLRYEATNPNDIFREARARPPRFGSTVVQVNHPRMGDIGYFDVMRFDRNELADFAARRPGWLSFDAVELYNGDDAVDIPSVEACMLDWFALLDGGYRITATGNSDSHRLTFHEPGLPRTYVKVPVDDPARFDEDAFVAAVRAGRAIVSGGPFVTLEVSGAGPGDTVAPGTLEVVITADAPDWMDVSSLELLVRGRLVARESAPFEVGPHRAELRERVALEPGDWVVAVVRGEAPMAPLFRRGVIPFAFTNPVWVR
ncbi:MAG: PHP domain-containing protein [Myxococcales bacterium]|nr:PHP domain-containing protein [Myxococcales bacterium]